MKYMDWADVILAVKISKTSEELVVSQLHYMDKILKKFNNNDYSMTRTLINTSQHLSKNKVEYSRIIENLIYLMSCIKLDITYSVFKLRK